MYLYQNLKVKFMRGKRINKKRMIRRKELSQIEDMTTTIAEAKEKLQEAKKQWDDFKLNAEKYRDEELIDQYEGVIKEKDGVTFNECRR